MSVAQCHLFARARTRTTPATSRSRAFTLPAGSLYPRVLGREACVLGPSTFGSLLGSSP
jgi:hypothetical protein